MKIIKVFQFLLLIILYTQLNNALAQESNIPNAVNEFWKTVNDYVVKYNGEPNFTKNYSSNEIDTLTKKYYRVISDNPNGLNMKLHIEYEKWDSLARKFHGMPHGLKPATKMYLMKKIISEKYGDAFTQIISVPYYLKVKIIADSGSIYEGAVHSKIRKTPRNILRTSQGNLIAVVEDIVKGNKFFKVGEKITISYLTFWIADGGKFFEKGNSYFIPLKPWEGFQDSSRLTISILPDQNFAIYPIKDEMLQTPGNYFEIKNESNWEEFKNAFQQKYILN